MSQDVNTRLHAPINRRRLIGGMAGAAVTTIAIGGLVSAQSTQTNASGTLAARSATDSESGAQENTVQPASDAIALIRGDRDSVASKIDVKNVDQILTIAMDLQSQASSATTSSAPSQDQLASAAEMTAWAARDLIEAELSPFGLPSRQIDVSQELADNHAAITAAGKTVMAAKSKNAATTSLLTISQQLYTSAYDQYGKGVFMQAEKTAEAASGLVDAIDELLSASDNGGGNTNGNSKGSDNHSDGEQNDASNGTPAASNESGANDSNQNDQGDDQQGDSSSAGGRNDGNDRQDNESRGAEPAKPVDVPKPSF